MDRIEQALAAEVAILDDRKAAAVEGHSTRIGDPERAQRLRDVVAVRGHQRDAIGIDLGLQDGHERRLVLANRDGLAEFVLKEVVKARSFGLRLNRGLGRFFIRRWWWWRGSYVVERFASNGPCRP